MESISQPHFARLALILCIAVGLITVVHLMLIICCIRALFKGFKIMLPNVRNLLQYEKLLFVIYKIEKSEAASSGESPSYESHSEFLQSSGTSCDNEIIYIGEQ